MATPSPTPAVDPSPYNLAINDVHEAIFGARHYLHSIEAELDFFSATALNCLAFLPAGDVATDDEVARVNRLADDVRWIAEKVRDLRRDMEKGGISNAFAAAAVEGLTAREKQIGVNRTDVVRFLERYLTHYSSYSGDNLGTAEAEAEAES